MDIDSDEDVPLVCHSSCMHSDAQVKKKLAKKDNSDSKVRFMDVS